MTKRGTSAPASPVSEPFDPEAATACVVEALRPLADPRRAAQEKRYLKSDLDFWVRRSALLALLPGIRHGQPDLARFGRYATPMLPEKEFFIRKAIGWVLREISKKDPAYVAEWTRGHLDQMSGVTFREAVRRLPDADAARLRAAYRNNAGS